MSLALGIAASVTLVCAILVVYPYALYPLILRLVKTRPVAAREDHKVSATLVFCAYNEARAMPEKIANIEMLKARHPDLEVLAFDDGSADATYEQLAARPELVTVVRGGGRNGKAHGMKLLAARATGEIMIFTDANVTLKEDAIDRLMAYYADPEVGGVCGSLHYKGEDSSATAAAGSLYWRLEEYLKKEESRTGNVMGADGSIFSLRRKLYPSFPDTVLDDLTVSMAAVFSGHRLIKAEDVIAYERLVAKRGEEFSRKVRIAARAFHTHLFLTPQLEKMTSFDRFKYGSRKMVRWFGGAFLTLGMIAAVVPALILSPSLLVAGAIVGSGLILLGARAQSGPLALVTEIVIALYATLLGVLRALRGQTFTVWVPAKSR
ncbi:glycosyltransferase [Mongoliimonas terrestris]|uniref:glycosyltransferase n=1 Tax=Mongoliimonas terrestris TaxID=1709001 RepID=UPI0009495979|nr:glycosyltransferase [Mongoliimonas terrestris]